MIDWWGPIIWEYYAGTEGMGMTLVNATEWLAHKGTVGRAVVGVLHICDDDGNELPPGENGGVYFSDGKVFEYHNDPEKTAQGRNAKGWTTLGDIGTMDAEGYLYLTDRKAHMIISGGVNIYPQEAENLLVTHPKVLDVAVFGVPNEEFGEEVKAVVQPRDMARGRQGARAGADRLLPRAAVGHQVPALDRLPGRAAAPPHRQALQAAAARQVLGWPYQQDRLTARHERQRERARRRCARWR